MHKDTLVLRVNNYLFEQKRASQMRGSLEFKELLLN